MTYNLCGVCAGAATCTLLCQPGGQVLESPNWLGFFVKLTVAVGLTLPKKLGTRNILGFKDSRWDLKTVGGILNTSPTMCQLVYKNTGPAPYIKFAL